MMIAQGASATLPSIWNDDGVGMPVRNDDGIVEQADLRLVEEASRNCRPPPATASSGSG